MPFYAQNDHKHFSFQIINKAITRSQQGHKKPKLGYIKATKMPKRQQEVTKGHKIKRHKIKRHKIKRHKIVTKRTLQSLKSL